MIYLLIGIMTVWHFYKKWGSPFAETKKDTISNLLMVVTMILIWPVFLIIEAVLRIRGEG